MARIKHIALATKDPAKTAAFYKETLGLTELNRRPADSGADGVWLSDGYIFFAILKLNSDEEADMGEGGKDFVGVHHIGFYVNDLEETSQALERAKALPRETVGKVVKKYKGPDGVTIDINARGWNDQIKARMQLLHLSPQAPD